MEQHDLFNEPHEFPSVQIKDNQILERACNRVLIMTKNDPHLLDGDSMGEIDHRLYAEILWQDCFQNLIAPQRKHVFIAVMLRSPDAEVYTRARRELLSRDLIRVSSKAVQSGERFRAKITGAMR